MLAIIFSKNVVGVNASIETQTIELPLFTVLSDLLLSRALYCYYISHNGRVICTKVDSGD